MEKIKELWAKFVHLLQPLIDYFKAEPVMLYVASGCALLILIAIIALCVSGAKKKKAKKRAKAAAKTLAMKSETANEQNVVPVKETAPEKEAAKTEEKSVEPIKAEPAQVESVKEEPVKVEVVKVEPVKVEPVKEEPVKTEEKTNAFTAAQLLAEEQKKAEEKPVAVAVEEKKPAEKKPVEKKPAAVEEKKPVKEEAPAPAPVKEEAPAKETAIKEETVVPTKISDLKDVPDENNEKFFDEHDEHDKIARYSGKWVICRIMTATGDEKDVTPTGEEMYFFELRASNGEKLLTSEEYTTYTGALNGINTHRNNIAKNNFKIMLSKKGDYIFKLLNGKNMLLCMGENYPTKARCESAIESAKRFAATAFIDENVQDIIVHAPAEDEEAPHEFVDNGYNGKWIIYSQTAGDGEQVFYFELFASNGEKLLSSEEYTTFTGAVNGITTHKTNIERGNFRVSLTKRGDYIYKLLNGNGQLLCLGEHYKTRTRCQNAVDSVKRFAKNAPILTDSENTK